jgi:hypothetical protein
MADEDITAELEAAGKEFDKVRSHPHLTITQY